MKKFKFSLESVDKYKKTVEKIQRAQLREAQAELRELTARMEALIEEFEQNRADMQRELQDGTADGRRLRQYAVYFARLREEREKLGAEIEKARSRLERCESALIITMRELKVYKKLRDEQYAEYMAETRAEDEKNVGDLVSFDEIAGGA